MWYKLNKLLLTISSVKVALTEGRIVNSNAARSTLRTIILVLSMCAILGLLLSSKVGFIASTSMIMVIIVQVCAAILALVYYPSRTVRIVTLFMAMLFTRLLVSDIDELIAKWGDAVDWNTQVYILGNILIMCMYPVMLAIGILDDKSKRKG